MSTVKRLHSQARACREGRPAFTLLELIVVLLVLGILAAVAVPTFTRVRENSVERVVQTTLEIIDRNGEAIATSDHDVTDAQLTQTVLAEVDPSEGMTITRDDAQLTVEYTSGSLTAAGTVTFSGGVGTIVAAAILPPPAAPGAPLISGVTAGDTILSVAFVAPGSDGRAAISDYEYALDGGAWVSAATTSSPFTIYGLTNGTAYTVTLRAVNRIGAGSVSAGESGTPVEATWAQRGVDLDGDAAGDYAGHAVALSSDGSVVAVGAPFNDGAATDAGRVRVYAWSGSSWVQRGAAINGEAANDNSGWSVALSSDGSVVAIGATGNDGSGSNAGHVRVYVWSGSVWVQRGADIDGETAGDKSGYSVALSSDGSVVAIGAPFNDNVSYADAGHVRVYSWDGSSWVRRGADIDGEGVDSSGRSVDLSSDGTVVAVGAPFNDGSGADAGHVRVYVWDGSSWVQRGGDIDGEGPYDNSGHSVALSSDGSVVAIGAVYNNGAASGAGHVRVYVWSVSVWVQRGADIDGEAGNDNSGNSVALSADGSVVAIGANANDGSGSNAGHIRVYEWNGSVWVQRGADIGGEAANDQSGFAVALSSDGSMAAVGSRYNDGSGANAGHVRVYTWG